MQGMADSGRSSRMMNLARATELKVDVMDVMRQTADHCQKLKETASIAVKILHARLFSDQERQNKQLQRHMTPRMQQTYGTYMAIANSWRCELHDIDGRIMQLQHCMEQNVPQLRESARASVSTGDSVDCKTTLVARTDSSGTPKPPIVVVKAGPRKNSTKLSTASRESSGSTLTLPRATSSSRSAKKVYRRVVDMKTETTGAASASDVLPQRIRTSNGWVVAPGRKVKKSSTVVKKQKSSGKSFKKTRFPKVDSGCNTSLVSLASAPGQDGASLQHKTPPHPWPDIFRKASKDLNTAREKIDRQSPCTPTSGPDGSSENVAATMTSSVLEIDFVDNDAEELFNQTP